MVSWDTGEQGGADGSRLAVVSGRRRGCKPAIWDGLETLLEREASRAFLGWGGRECCGDVQ